MSFKLELSEEERQLVMHVLEIFRQELDENLSHYEEHGEFLSNFDQDPKQMDTWLKTSKKILYRMGDRRPPPEGLGLHRVEP